MRRLLYKLFGLTAPFKFYCFLRSLPSRGIRRKYERVFAEHSLWFVRKHCDQVTAHELFEPGLVYAPYIPLTQIKIGPTDERYTNYRSWAKKEIARMEEEMDERDAPATKESAMKAEPQFIIVKDDQLFREEMMRSIIEVTDRYYDLSTDHQAQLERDLTYALFRIVHVHLDKGTLIINPLFKGDPFNVGKWISWTEENDPTTLVICFVPPGKRPTHGNYEVEIPRSDRSRSGPRRLGARNL